MANTPVGGRTERTRLARGAQRRARRCGASSVGCWRRPRWGAARRGAGQGHPGAGLVRRAHRVVPRWGDRLVAAGALPDRRSLFMVTVEELPAFVKDPASFAAVIPARARGSGTTELNGLRAAVLLRGGRLPDPSSWALTGRWRRRASATGARCSWGSASPSGVATGRARIVRDPADPRPLEPGDVLVAPITDPAWTPLFLAAEAVVVDVGVLQSHAAIVAREASASRRW